MHKQIKWEYMDIIELKDWDSNKLFKIYLIKSSITTNEEPIFDGCHSHGQLIFFPQNS